VEYKVIIAPRAIADLYIKSSHGELFGKFRTKRMARDLKSSSFSRIVGMDGAFLLLKVPVGKGLLSAANVGGVV
jgi:hypothetical protein